MANVGAAQFSKFILVMLLLSPLVGCSRGGPAADAQQPRGVPVQLKRLQTETVEDSSEFVGNLESRRSVQLRSDADGRIVQIPITSGDRVTAGSLLLQLKPERSEANLAGAEAGTTAARAARENALAEVRAQEAQRVSDLANLRLQETQYRRTAVLVAEGAQAQQNLDQAIQARDAAAAQLRATEQRIRAAQASVTQQEALFRQAQQNANAVGQDVVDTRITAPFTGTVGDVPAKVGDYVQQGDVLATITQSESLDLRISIPLEKGPELRIGLPVQITDSQGKPLRDGQISFISPQVTAEAQTILVKATFNNADGKLRDGQFVRARVIWDRSPGVLVPTAAISRLGGQAFVFVAEKPKPPTPGQAPEGQAEPSQQGQPQGEPPALVARQRAVKLGDIQENSYQVLEGVKSGEQIVVSGVLNLSDGVPIVPESPNNQQGQENKPPG